MKSQWLAMATLMACAAPDARLKLSPSPTVRTLRVGRASATLVARVTGPSHAPVLLAIAGGPGYSRGYMEAFEQLCVAASPWQVVTYDARGVGLSHATPTATFLLEDTLADLDAVRASVGSEPVVLLGHSYGAVVAEAYAIAHPEHVRALVLVDAMPDRKQDLARSALASSIRAKALRSEGLMAAPSGPAGDDCSGAMNGDLPADFADPRHPAARALPNTVCRESIAARTFQGLGEYDFSLGLSSLRMPVFLLFGAADPNAFELGVLGKQLVGSPTLSATFEQCGHYPFLECPGFFFEKLEALLSGLPPSRP